MLCGSRGIRIRKDFAVKIRHSLTYIFYGNIFAYKFDRI